MNARLGQSDKPTGAALAVAIVILAAQAAQDRGGPVGDVRCLMCETELGWVRQEDGSILWQAVDGSSCSWGGEHSPPLLDDV